ncbi:MAG TPA: magnesium chelatase domain-containing protein [Pirellulales bacterium]|nr:magnesium chelatase domain-containing protein [Pirellulales bacterium]
MPVEVEVSDSPLPKTVLVGLPEAAVKECTYHIERALINSGFRRPGNGVVINLARADLSQAGRVVRPRRWKPGMIGVEFVAFPKGCHPLTETGRMPADRKTRVEQRKVAANDGNGRPP